MKPIKDERNHHGAVDNSFSEQRIRIIEANYILCEKNWTRTRSGPGSLAGRQMADEIQVNLEIFKNHCRNAFQVFFRVKSIVKLVLKCEIHEAI